ncbi:hypothetical protein AGMMS50276_24640 [Synergistales bacterium]|nr:hypothetical protein AGMMS50276_24640 [Synergistales bacterium]
MERIVSEEPMIAKALTIGEIFNLDKAERQRARSRRDAVIGLNIAMGASYHSGIEKGKTEGKAEGKAEVVKSAFALNLPIEQIEKLTGLSRADIESIRSSF